jgi:hypothetical protein
MFGRGSSAALHSAVRRFARRLLPPEGAAEGPMTVIRRRVCARSGEMTGQASRNKDPRQPGKGRTGDPDVELIVAKGPEYGSRSNRDARNTASTNGNYGSSVRERSAILPGPQAVATHKRGFPLASPRDMLIYSPEPVTGFARHRGERHADFAKLSLSPLPNRQQHRLAVRVR